VAAFLAESPTPAGADSLSTGEPVYVAWVVAASYRQAALDLAHELTATDEMRAALAALVPHC